MGPDLTLARTTAEAVFDATCTVTADPQGHTDDLRNTTTLELTPPANDTTTIYSGPCLIRPSQGLGQNDRIEGEAQQFVDRYDLRLPVTAVGVVPGNTVTIDSAPNDPELVDAEFTVLQVAVGSFAVTRRITLQRRTRGPRL